MSMTTNGSDQHLTEGTSRCEQLHSKDFMVKYVFISAKGLSSAITSNALLPKHPN